MVWTLHSRRFRPFVILGLFIAAAVAIEVPARDRKARKAKPAAEVEGDADQFRVVDCLLPGQVRKLGRRTTYVTQRRPIRTTASDCEIRGGEYVAFDRADYATALKVWLAEAEQGDPQAQTYVGEIFEKGLGTIPDYEAAAVWYRKAAEQGFAAAQINLGHLYEQGLGVEKDPRKALDWYRQAAGLPAGMLVLDGTDSAAPDASRVELSRLQTELTRVKTERSELETALSRTQDQLAAARESGQRAEDQQREVTRLQGLVSSYEQKLATAATRQTELEDQRRTTQELLAELERTRAVLDDARRELRDAVHRATGLERELAEVRQQLAGTDTPEARVAELRLTLDRLEQKLGRERAEREALEETSRKQEQRLRELQQTERDRLREEQVTLAAGSVAPPMIELIDPPLVGQRGAQRIVTRSGVTERLLIGRVTAPAGLRTFSINDRRTPVEPSGLFETSLAVGPTRSLVELVAVDNQGERTEIEFELVPQAQVGDVPPERASPATEVSVDLGPYTLLAIGNNDYREWPDLRTAVSDVEALAEILETRYGFETRVLINATRYEIMAALNALRTELDEKSNLIIYFAGHGQMISEIQRGYWLPVDAELDSNANWIPTSDISEQMMLIPAKHILVVADSCYSGTLTRSTMARLQQGMSSDALRSLWSKMAATRVRAALTSGGLEPVMDEGGGEHSIFARALLDVLSENGDVLETQKLYREVAARVIYAAEAVRFNQEPQYTGIRHAGHEGGDFLFPRPRLSTTRSALSPASFAVGFRPPPSTPALAP